MHVDRIALAVMWMLTVERRNTVYPNLPLRLKLKRVREVNLNQRNIDRRVNMSDFESINSFQGEYRWLSNFWPVKVEMDGRIYPSVEHAYVAAKTLDDDKREEICSISTPREVKRFGRNLNLRDDWGLVKLEVMGHLTWEKYRNPELRSLLLETGDRELVEGNTWGDQFWGVSRGKGHNHLGKILMQCRARIKQEEKINYG